MREDGTPALLASIALYFQFFDGRAFNDSATKRLLLRVLARRLESEAEAANGGREGLEGRRRTKPSLDWRRNRDRRVASGQDGTRMMIRCGGS